MRLICKSLGCCWSFFICGGGFERISITQKRRYINDRELFLLRLVPKLQNLIESKQHKDSLQFGNGLYHKHFFCKQQQKHIYFQYAARNNSACKKRCHEPISCCSYSRKAIFSRDLRYDETLSARECFRITECKGLLLSKKKLWNVLSCYIKWERWFTSETTLFLYLIREIFILHPGIVLGVSTILYSSLFKCNNAVLFIYLKENLFCIFWYILSCRKTEKVLEQKLSELFCL